MKQRITIVGLSATVTLVSIVTLAFFFLLPGGGGDDPCKTCGAHPVATKTDDCGCPAVVWVDEAAAKEWSLTKGWHRHRHPEDSSKVYSIEEMRGDGLLVYRASEPTDAESQAQKQSGFRCPRFLDRPLPKGDALALTGARYDRREKLDLWLYYDHGRQGWFLRRPRGADEGEREFDVPLPACSHLAEAMGLHIPHPTIDDANSYELYYGVEPADDKARRPYYDADPYYRPTPVDPDAPKPRRLHPGFDGDKQKALLNLRDLFYHPDAGRIDPKTNRFWCDGKDCRHCDAIIEIALEGVTSDNFKHMTDLDRDRRLFDMMRRLEREGETPKPPAAVPVDDDTTRAERRAKLFDRARGAREKLGKLRYDDSQLRRLADAYGNMKMSDRQFALDLLAKIARQEDLLADIEMELDQALFDLLDLYEEIAAKVQARRYLAPSDFEDGVERKKRLEARKQIDLEIEALKEKLRDRVGEIEDRDGIRFSSSALGIDEIGMGEGGASEPTLEESLNVSVVGSAGRDLVAGDTRLHRGKAFVGENLAETVERLKQGQHQLHQGRQEQDPAEADRAAQMKRQEEDEEEQEFFDPTSSADDPPDRRPRMSALDLYAAGAAAQVPGPYDGIDSTLAALDAYASDLSRPIASRSLAGVGGIAPASTPDGVSAAATVAAPVPPSVRTGLSFSSPVEQVQGHRVGSLYPRE